jgi:hypothetical protein
MKTTYQKIVENIIHIEEEGQQNPRNNIFSLKYKYIPGSMPPIQQIFFRLLLNRLFPTVKLNMISKIHFFWNTINNFYFTNKPEERNEFIGYFCKMQKVYHALNRFIFLYKWKKATLVVNTDMQLNEISPNQPNVICIYQANSRYLFKMEDLLKIIYSSLTNTYLFFSEPLPIKNPYNNLPFGKSILYTIYLFFMERVKLQNLKYQLVHLFLQFKEQQFDMTLFVNANSIFLRDCAIRNYIVNSTKSQLKADIARFIKQFNATKPSKNQILVDLEFPDGILVEIMKPYLQLYLNSCYSLSVSSQHNANYILEKKLREFQKYNPNFGKRNLVFKYVLKHGKMQKLWSHIEFDKNYKKFHICNNDLFMINHLTYKENQITGDDIASEDTHFAGANEYDNEEEDEYELDEDP